MLIDIEPIGLLLFVIMCTSISNRINSSVVARRNHKLSSLYFGPYVIEDKVGSVAYKLKFPVDALIHPVFHVSQLKKKVPPFVLTST